MTIAIQKNSTVFNPVFTSWFYCPHCWNRQEQRFIRDDGIYEVYRCENCKEENRKAVR